MSILNLKLLNNIHQIVCEDGKEDHVQEIANRLNKKLNNLAEQLPKATENKIFLMALLILEDELSELKKKVSELSTAKIVQNNSDHTLSETIAKIADYIEDLANQYEKE